MTLHLSVPQTCPLELVDSQSPGGNAEGDDAIRPPGCTTWAYSHNTETMQPRTRPGDMHQHIPHQASPSEDEVGSEHGQKQSLAYATAQSYPMVVNLVE